jgi:hypothetical protein
VPTILFNQIENPSKNLGPNDTLADIANALFPPVELGEGINSRVPDA